VSLPCAKLGELGSPRDTPSPQGHLGTLFCIASHDGCKAISIILMILHHLAAKELEQAEF